jgi:F-type H+-transporting ATPase subunit gamma
MANPRVLLKRRKAVVNTRKITKTMEMISTARLSRAQNAAIAARPYAKTLERLVGDLARASDDLSHPLIEVHDPARRAAVLVMVSDRGLCGAFNANILRGAWKLHDELKARGVTAEYIVQGKKGVAAFKYRQIPVAKAYLMVSIKPSYERADEIGSAWIERYVRRELDEAYIVYSTFRSMVSQVPRVEKILPLAGLAAAGPNEPAAAKEGAGAQAAGPGMGFLFHPGPREILARILPLVVKTAIFTAMLETCAGEHAARRISMKNATDAADEMTRYLTQAYNRARQSKITQEIAEIVGGANALA